MKGDLYSLVGRCADFVCVEAVSTAELSLHFPAITFAPNTSSTLWVDRMNFPSGLLKIEVKC